MPGPPGSSPGARESAPCRSAGAKIPRRRRGSAAWSVPVEDRVNSWCRSLSAALPGRHDLHPIALGKLGCGASLSRHEITVERGCYLTLGKTTAGDQLG